MVRSQLDLHAAYGGVVPEIAARAHVELLDAAILQALAEAELGFDGVDAVAATAGPGLVGGLIVGVTMGEGHRAWRAACRSSPSIISRRTR